jgi:hypothetical protein
MLRKISSRIIAFFLYLFVLPFKIKKIREEEGIISIYSHFPNRKQFERLIKWFEKRNYEFISTEELIHIIKNKMNTTNKIWLSFDDGLKTNIKDILPVLKKYKVPATFFIAPNLHNQSNRFMSPNDIRILNSSNLVTIGNHTLNHVDISTLALKEAKRELQGCNYELMKLSNYNSQIFSYPFGRYNKDVLELLKNENFILAASTQSTYITGNTDLLLVPRCGFGEHLTLTENICHCFGIWQPTINKIKSVLK